MGISTYYSAHFRYSSIIRSYNVPSPCTSKHSIFPQIHNQLMSTNYACPEGSRSGAAGSIGGIEGGGLPLSLLSLLSLSGRGAWSSGRIGMYPLSSRVSRVSSQCFTDSNEDDGGKNSQLYLDDRRIPASPLQNPSFLHYPLSYSPTQVKRPHLSSLSQSPLPYHHSPGNQVMLFPTSSLNLGELFSSSLQSGSEDFDILSYLPPEISIKILLYLQPEDLCM